MPKEAFSWSKPEGKAGLIARKRIDWSMFEDGTHIPKEFTSDFVAANGGVDLAPRESRDLVLIIEGNAYTAKLYKRTHVDAYQIRYDSNHDLKRLLRERFQQSLEYISSIRASAGSGKVNVKVPESHAQYADFYQTGTPFLYRVELISTPDDKPVTGFARVWADLSSIIGDGLAVPTLSKGKLNTLKWTVDGVEVTTGSGTATVDRGNFERAWSRLEAAKIVTANDLPGRSRYRSTAITAILSLLPYVDFTVKPETTLFLTAHVFTSSQLDNTFGVRTMRRIGWKGKLDNPTLVVFTSDAGSTGKKDNPYQDRWVGDVFRYTGEGPEGDQTLTGGNLALQRNIGSSFPIYGFRQQGKDQYVYMGRFQVTEVRQEQQSDRLGNLRNVHVFQMKSADKSRGQAIQIPDHRDDEEDTQAASEMESIPDLEQICAAFDEALAASYVHFGGRQLELVRSFVASLATKRFVILTGLSGSGKTQLALRFGDWIGPNRCLLVPVRPDWTGSESVFGYENALHRPPDGQREWHVPDALAFMLRAAADPTNPYLLVLDEMNLAHVERYFADVLSGMESREECLPNLVEKDGHWYLHNSSPRRRFPDNLFIVGTVNVDETTYMFSPKVLDRANTFEFRVDTDDLLLDAIKPERCSPGAQGLIKGFLEIASDDQWHTRHAASGRDTVAQHFRQVHRLLSASGFEFGHRVFYEAIRFAGMLDASGEHDPLVTVDLQIMQKVLPRLHGTRKRLEATLCALGQYCAEMKYDEESVADGPASRFNPLATLETKPALPRSFDKIKRMTRSLRANQFTSFTEQ